VIEYLKVISIIIFPTVVFLLSVSLTYLIEYLAGRSVYKMMDIKRESIAKDFKLFIFRIIHEFGPSKLDHYISERRIQKLLDKEYMKHKKGES